MRYPSTGVGPQFAQGLIKLFYGPSLGAKVEGIYALIKYSVFVTSAVPIANDDKQKKA